MSTGVFRPYPTQRLKAPGLNLGTTLDAPPAPSPVLGAYERRTSNTFLIECGIAALIPVAAQYVPPCPVERVGGIPYPNQEPANGIAALIPIAQNFVAPNLLPLIARVQYSAQEPGSSVAPYLTSNVTDAPIGYSMVIAPRTSAPNTQLPSNGIAPLIQVTASYVFPQPLAQFSPRADERAALAATDFLPQPSDWFPKTSVLVLQRATYPVQQITVYGQPWVPSDYFAPSVAVQGVHRRPYPIQVLGSNVVPAPLAAYMPPALLARIPIAPPALDLQPEYLLTPQTVSYVPPSPVVTVPRASGSPVFKLAGNFPVNPVVAQYVTRGLHIQQPARPPSHGYYVRGQRSDWIIVDNPGNGIQLPRYRRVWLLGRLDLQVFDVQLATPVVQSRLTVETNLGAQNVHMLGQLRIIELPEPYL